MADIIHQVGIKAPAGEVYALLTTKEGIAKWWTSDVYGGGAEGSVIQFRFNGSGPDFIISRLEEDKQVCWKHTGDMPEAWMGTEVKFQLNTEGEQTFIRFTHAHWKDATDFMAHCSTKWAVFLLSLKDAAETGKGRPFPDDIQIDHN